MPSSSYLNVVFFVTFYTEGSAIKQMQLKMCIRDRNYPNPFKSGTVISMQLAQAGYGTLTIYDIQGRIVKNVSKNWEKGYNEIRIDKALLSSPGIWYYKFDSKFFNSTRKMVLID